MERDNGNRDWQSLFDLVLSLHFGWFTLLFNADYEVTPHGIDPNTRKSAERPLAKTLIAERGRMLRLDRRRASSVTRRGRRLRSRRLGSRRG